MKEYIFQRDDYTCQYCKKRFPGDHLTIDHLIPLAHRGIDELTNHVTACKSCNEKKGSMNLSQFARYINIDIKRLPVHGDPIIDDANLPIQFRLLRKRILDKTRAKDGRLQRSKEAQKRLKNVFKLEFHGTELGRLFMKFSNLVAEGKLKVDLRIGHYPDGRPHDHGTGFRVLPRYLPECFNSIVKII